MALRRRFLPVFKKHAPRGKPRFAKPLQGHFGPAAKHSQKHKNRPKIGRFSHFNPSAEMHPFSLFSASKAPQKWLCDAICRKKQLFAGSFGSRSHSFCSFTFGHLHRHGGLAAAGAAPDGNYAAPLKFRGCGFLAGRAGENTVFLKIQHQEASLSSVDPAGASVSSVSVVSGCALSLEESSPAGSGGYSVAITSFCTARNRSAFSRDPR